MSKEVRKYFPEYRINSSGGSGLPEVDFRYGGVYFVARLPLFGATETQKAVVEWASWSLPPVMWVSHKKPTSPDRDWFNDPSEPCRQYTPYAMAIATLQCLGETATRRVKIYFCDVCVSVHGTRGWIRNDDYKDFFAVELDSEGKEIPFRRSGSRFLCTLPPISTTS